MKSRIALLLLLAVTVSCESHYRECPRLETLLTEWEFSRDSINWTPVTVPHDWAIEGPFDRANDLQVVQVTQNFETAVTEHTGRTGGLPYMGKGWYRTRFDVAQYRPIQDVVTLLFDGAMSQACVKVNGQFVIEWQWASKPSFTFFLTLNICLILSLSPTCRLY